MVTRRQQSHSKRTSMFFNTLGQSMTPRASKDDSIFLKFVTGLLPYLKKMTAESDGKNGNSWEIHIWIHEVLTNHIKTQFHPHRHLNYCPRDFPLLVHSSLFSRLPECLNIQNAEFVDNELLWAAVKYLIYAKN